MIYFKTKINFASKFSLFTNNLFYHPIEPVNEPINMICPIGHCLAYIGVIFIIIRLFFKNSLHKKYLYNFHYPIVFIIILFSLINFNSFVYLVPLFLYEIFIYPNF